MALFRLDRGRRAGRYLEWKVRIFAVGAVLGLAGIWLDLAWMRLSAIGILFAGMLVRFLPGAEEHPAEDDDDDPDEPTHEESSSGDPPAR